MWFKKTKISQIAPNNQFIDTILLRSISSDFTIVSNCFCGGGGGESYDNVVGGGRVSFVGFLVGVVVIMMVATLVLLVVVLIILVGIIMIHFFYRI